MATRKPKIKIYQDKADEWRWQAKASNGKIIDSSSEGFSSRGACERNLEKTANTLYKTECEELHLKYFIIGMLTMVIDAPKAWYQEVATDCIAYIKHNKMLMGVGSAHEILYERVVAYKCRERKRIIDKDELPKPESRDKKS